MWYSRKMKRRDIQWNVLFDFRDQVKQVLLPMTEAHLLELIGW